MIEVISFQVMKATYEINLSLTCIWETGTTNFSSTKLLLFLGPLVRKHATSSQALIRVARF